MKIINQKLHLFSAFDLVWDVQTNTAPEIKIPPWEIMDIRIPRNIEIFKIQNCRALWFLIDNIHEMNQIVRSINVQTGALEKTPGPRMVMLVFLNTLCLWYITQITFGIILVQFCGFYGPIIAQAESLNNCPRLLYCLHNTAAVISPSQNIWGDIELSQIFTQLKRHASNSNKAKHCPTRTTSDHRWRIQTNSSTLG